ncbi:amidohydrolase family protein [Kitasatospora sp. NPDC057015]|uniref:amidohydrolase family protein n=1 Tax=Kitasatospora sp. NPDC057015 TaxID=3346001 RepID=UPI0036290C46
MHASPPPDLVLVNARVADGADLVDIHLGGGLIRSIGTRPPGPAPNGTPPTGAGADAERLDRAERLDCAGRVVIPGLIESHLHLDKALLDRERPNPDGTLAGAIAVTGALNRAFTAKDVRDRARAVLDDAVANGTTLVRAHPDVDPIVGLLALDVMLELREEYRGVVDLQVVAFPQEGVLRAEGTLDLLREALRRGADVIGGCTYNEADLTDCRRQVDLVLDLAVEFGVPADLHADFADDAADPRFAMAGYIARAVTERGLRGRVALGHMTSLAGRPPAERGEVLAALAAAGVAVVPLPATDMHLNGRADTVNPRRGVAPVRELWAAGVACAYSSNNVRNAFTPYGNADLLEVGLFLAQTGHLSGPEDLARVLAMATTEAARVVGVADRYGLRPGAAADLVVLDTHNVRDVLLDRPARTAVIKGGRIVARSTRTTDLLFRTS